MMTVLAGDAMGFASALGYQLRLISLCTIYII